MPSPPLHLSRGTLHIAPYAPDGDSVRFAPRDPASLQSVDGARRLRFSHDGTVQLRLQGIDVPELHYGGHAQPLGMRSRDALLAWARATEHDTRAIHGAILCARTDVHGRPIAYLVHPDDAPHLVDGAVVTPTDRLLRTTANAHMLATGAAYLLAYATLGAREQALFTTLAHDARRHRRGVWAHDATRTGVSVQDFAALEPPSGALLFPKLFRRLVDWLKRRAAGQDVGFREWMREADENDLVVVREGASVPFDTIVHEQNGRVWLGEDPLELTFVDR